jgi:hypothetical protein
MLIPGTRRESCQVASQIFGSSSEIVTIYAKIYPQIIHARGVCEEPGRPGFQFEVDPEGNGVIISLRDLETQVGLQEILALLDSLSRRQSFQPVPKALDFPGQQSRVPELPGTLVRWRDPTLYDQPVGVELVAFDIGELVAGYPKLELRKVSTP